jgi:hypothetical protein
VPPRIKKDLFVPLAEVPNPSRDAARLMMQEIKATKLEDRIRKPKKSELLKRLMTEN